MWNSLKNLFAGGASGENAPPCSTQAEQPSEPQKNEAEAAQPADLTAFYAELGLDEEADLGAVRRAWKQGLKEVHMDHYSDDPDTRRRAQDRARRLNEAYRTLQKVFS